MEHQFQRPTTPKSSSTSAINLTGSPAGISSTPGSPSLEPSDSHGSFARRRTSWGQRLLDAGQDPLRLDPFEAPHSAPLSSSALSSSSTSRPALSTTADSFSSPTDDRSFPFSARYGSQHNTMNTYSTSQAGPSTASLITPREFESDEGQREDDEAHLTSNMSRNAAEGGYDVGDPEGNAAMTPRSRRRTLRYSTSPSPLKKTGTAIKSMGHNIRRASVRVVNLASAGLESQLRLGDVDDTGQEEEPLPDLTKALPIRGRTLGCLGPDSKVRLALFNFLVYPWTEPIILVLIIINAVVLSIQAAVPLTLTTSDGTAVPAPVRGYFHSWEDYALFVLFIVFTLEAFARICVSGFLFDPEISMSSLFRSPFKGHSDPYPPTSSGAPNAPVTRSGSRSQAALHRGTSITKRLKTFKNTLLRPFALKPHVPRSPYPNVPAPSEVTLTNSMSDSQAAGDPFAEKIFNTAHGLHSAIRDPSNTTFLSKAMRSDDRDAISLPFRLSVTNAHDKALRNLPYLRQSWTRIDFIAIVSFWIAFTLAIAGLEKGQHHIGIFRAMSVIRTARLLTITSGTTTIMHSLKTARPLLTRVAYFVLFAMVLFSIIGIQSFKGSLRRTCLLAPTLGEGEIQIDGQFCGGYVDPVSMNATGYLLLDGGTSSTVKGYVCPLGQICKEQENPANNIESFDTIWYAALQMVIVASANGWTPLMYSMIDAEYFFSCFFFIIAVVVLNFWLINLFVAVITNTFSAIRSETKKSAFGAAPLEPISDEQDEGWTNSDGRKPSRSNLAKTIYGYTRWCWVLLALASLVLQASRSVEVDETHELVMYYGELAITIAFDIEIVLRVLATLPDWRSFFSHGNNWLDSILAIGSSIIQIPVIHNSSVYPWFTIFQLARFYRVILVVPRMKPLLLAVFGNMYGLANMSLFLILINYIAALAAVQLLRGDMGEDTPMNFGDLWTSFLGIYQVFSSENWTDILYSTAGAEIRLGQTIIIALFISAWMLFANFIVLQMFIAVINENFDVAEESKKGQQASKYWASHQAQQGSASWLRRLNPYRWVRANPVKVKVENLPANLVLPMQKSLVQDYSMPRYDDRSPVNKQPIAGMSKPRHYSSKSLNALERLFAGESRSNDVAMTTLRHGRKDTGHDDETERHLELLASVNPEGTTTEDMSDALYERRAQKADFIRDHPSYDKTFWIFSQKNILRRLCQKVVQPANGERIFGTPYSPIAHPLFQLVLLLTVIGGIVVESIATPVYRRNYFIEHGFRRGAWFDIAESAFGFTLVVEFLIKIIADGFAFTPNAYLRSIWNILDFFVMAGILVNVTTGLIFIGGLSRFTRSLKALRALRLITLIDRMRNTFQSLIISGASRILDAAILAILYMIPYAVWGLNIFAGKMNVCNDSDATGIADCTGEYSNTVLGESFGFLVPRVWDNPSPSTTFSFDSFRSSLLILFEIVSLEGWTDVMVVANSITGKGLQPETNNSQFNAIFFVIYNIMGAVVILTLFVSIIIGNFSSKTGSAFLTKPQREWIDLQKLFKRQKPSKRPPSRPSNPIRAWCFDRAVHKHGWWSRAMTLLFILHIVALMTQTFTARLLADTFRNDFFLGLMFVYLTDVVVRCFGLGWKSFRANGWNLFDIVVAGGSFITTIIVRFGASGFVIQQLQKLFLVSIAFKLVQRTNSLNMLFKTAVASLPVILSLLGLWLILFIFFAILFVEVFSLTKWSSGETRSMNYSSMGSSLVMLAFMSVGEGWNKYMHDYALSYPRCTNASPALPESDCGSEGWAFALFIAWNLLSMYIFVNMFTGVVVENFSYVFQTSTGGAKSITREQMRSFKKVWAEFANGRTGYLERHQFVPFFAKLSGAFEVKIYPTEYSIPNIKAACKASTEPEMNWSSRIVDGIDMGKLDAVLSGVDYAQIRKRRAIYSRLYHEASISHQQGRGISFNDMLVLLAHHKLIVDGEALILKDLVVRTETNKLVTDLVNLDRVRSLLKTISHRRRFLAYKEQLLAEQQQADIPSIVVDTLPESSYSPTTPDRSPYSSNPGSPTPDRRFHTPDVSLALDMTARLQRSHRRASDISMLSTEHGYASQRTSMSEVDPQNVLSSMQNSMWGDLMLEAADEDERM
ncbi:Calcium-channel protein cch1 [Hypsizygus marmoreus]|uniref:Calcium-channel protein CCH1 n=1 Tax=Hypsizygus marmoreus TaxID=39966 RepID=A0A369JSM4_HYPMA|nr:Calcium-channel protein cch1 [Hypsizygus marmoreus]